MKKESMSGIIGVSGASSFSDVSLCKYCLPLQGVACMSFNAAAFAVSIFRLLSKLGIVLNCPQNVLLYYSNTFTITQHFPSIPESSFELFPERHSGLLLN